MAGPKLNEHPVLKTRPQGRARAVEPTNATARSVARYVRVSPYKVREVLDLVRGHDVERALDILRFCERDAAILVSKVLGSAVANAEHNQQVVSDELFVSACFADEGPTLKRWRPRARGRATRIRKRTCHITVIVSRLPESSLARRRTERPAAVAERRRRRTGQDEGGRPTRRRAQRAAETSTATESVEAPAVEVDDPISTGTEEPTTTDDSTPPDDPATHDETAFGERPEGKE
jgi:large subunit ribosomal protein L22